MKTLIRASFATLVAGLLIAGCQGNAAVSVQPGTPSPSPNNSSMLVVGTNFKATGSSTTATGTGNVTLSPDKRTLNVSATANGLTSAPNAAHIHRADAPGGNGPVVKNLTLNGNTATATWSLTDAEQPFTATLLDDLRAGRLYINFHTTANPNGELRADLTAQGM